MGTLGQYVLSKVSQEGRIGLEMVPCDWHCSSHKAQSWRGSGLWPGPGMGMCFRRLASLTEGQRLVAADPPPADAAEASWLGPLYGVLFAHGSYLATFAGRMMKVPGRHPISRARRIQPILPVSTNSSSICFVTLSTITCPDFFFFAGRLTKSDSARERNTGASGAVFFGVLNMALFLEAAGPFSSESRFCEGPRKGHKGSSSRPCLGCVNALIWI